MATIYPQDQRYHEPESPAERRLYPLMAALPDDYTVLCNRSWFKPARRGRPPEPAEADFLVAHPERGILVVEVKGGAIRHDPASDRWWSGSNQLKESPFKQVERTRYRLRDLLEDGPLPGARALLGEAVCFADCTRVRSNLPPGLVPERVIFAEDLNNLLGALGRAFELWGLSSNQADFGKRGVRILTEALAGSIAIERHIGREVGEADRRLLDLTVEQYRVLDQLAANPRVCVLGGAGTGKTLLAVEQTRRLASQGQRVLLTCFNQPLAAHMEEQVADLDGVEAVHFHGLCRAWAKDARLDHRQLDNEPDDVYNDERLPSLLADAAAELGRSVDAIIVDEAQDFLPDWLAVLSLLLSDERHGTLFLFADENQAIYRRQFEVGTGFFRFRLTDNLRNTAQIHALLCRHFDERSVAKGPDGIEVALRSWSGERGLAQAVSSQLTNLTTHGVEVHDIAVLSGHSVANSRLAAFRKEPLGSFYLATVPKRSNDVRFASVHRFKGLESPVVILCEMDDVHPAARRRLWYTALSRARVGLFVLVRDEDERLDEVGIDGVLDSLLSEP